ncbi:MULTISPECIES: peroxiredoxin [Pseudomonas aeruginosa group]|uniref:Thioredoxin peroxidase n=1 Tax=Pseudomonas paraeruginosa TaxID=2994495 RepID=A0A2R3ITN3_9PSED|nr:MULTISPECIES: peroxiredoxin [Pseudomonas aeruginosa group]VTS65917.1 alkyl hydroperoxide reductase [Streptococcus dysgalactiae subsp. equisimilis]AVK05282.1 C-terminal domain of 1-Cys peroxiredoxin family protein [Pseudomonas paraeruginosa]AVR69288.1 peroxiredoxin [Pseudomonas paraeruginosa]AWE92878.1 C-terminal domain of 1-Cys peroxiredoxin family protein [Pseudomonas paraeruginosa]KAB0742665.1 peroxiredoxin [Pseudomonas aeruginosa]
MSVLVNKQAPDFNAAAVLGDGSIVDSFQLSSLRGKYVVLFFWPLDFTFVCPSEIIAHNNRMDKFRELGVEVVGVSIDSQFTHHAWRSTPVEKGGIGAVEFTMVADLKHEITRAYGIEHDDGVALRASFLIDRAGVVQHQVVNNLPLGREVDEMVRLVEALQFTEEHGEVCPAGWRKGRKGMQASAAGVAAYLAENAEAL